MCKPYQESALAAICSASESKEAVHTLYCFGCWRNGWCRWLEWSGFFTGNSFTSVELVVYAWKCVCLWAHVRFKGSSTPLFGKLRIWWVSAKYRASSAKCGGIQIACACERVNFLPTLAPRKQNRNDLLVAKHLVLECCTSKIVRAVLTLWTLWFVRLAICDKPWSTTSWPLVVRTTVRKLGTLTPINYPQSCLLNSAAKWSMNNRVFIERLRRLR